MEHQQCKGCTWVWQIGVMELRDMALQNSGSNHWVDFWIEMRKQLARGNRVTSRCDWSNGHCKGCWWKMGIEVWSCLEMGRHTGNVVELYALQKCSSTQCSPVSALLNLWRGASELNMVLVKVIKIKTRTKVEMMSCSPYPWAKNWFGIYGSLESEI